MKKIILLSIALLILFVNSYSQDTAKIYGLNLPAKIICYIAPMCTSPENDSLFKTFLSWRAKFRETDPSLNTNVLTDSISTIELAKLYNYCLSNSEGMAVSKDFKTAISGARLANSFLNTLCTNYELYYSDRFGLLRKAGRKLLLGK